MNATITRAIVFNYILTGWVFFYMIDSFYDFKRLSPAICVVSLFERQVYKGELSDIRV